jgi:heat shock protein HslJ
VTGNSGCNSFRGQYRRETDSITFGPIASTKRGCRAPAGDREQALYRVLPEIRRLQVFRGDLLLLAGAGRTRLQLRPGVGLGG